MKIEVLKEAITELRMVPFLMKTTSAEKVLDCTLAVLTEQAQRIEKLERELLAVSRG